ncbi:MAG: hypothetical protein P8126_10200 [Gammaproteobacteria bacterium]
MNRREIINRFLAVSYLYFRLTNNSAEYINAEELEELIEYLNVGNEPVLCPDQHIA